MHFWRAVPSIAPPRNRDCWLETDAGYAAADMAEEQKTAVEWGEWMGAWKDLDIEQERLTRQAAAYGADTQAKIKALSVLIVGCRGVGVEAAKNLILSNVGAVRIRDPSPASIRDMGTNCYITEAHVNGGVNRDAACIDALKSLNPFCDVELFQGELGTTWTTERQAPFHAVVVTSLLPRRQLLQLNEAARARNVAFIMAVNAGVTASVFSDFGPRFEIADLDGEPTQPVAVTNIEVITKPPCLGISGVDDGAETVIVTVGVHVGDIQTGAADVWLEFDDHSGTLDTLNGTQYEWRKVYLSSPRAAQVQPGDVFTGLGTQTHPADPHCPATSAWSCAPGCKIALPDLVAVDLCPAARLSPRPASAPRPARGINHKRGGALAAAVGRAPGDVRRRVRAGGGGGGGRGGEEQDP